jgi:hypothetical protein
MLHETAESDIQKGRMTRKTPLIGFTLLTLSCASNKSERASPGTKDLPPLPRSSIAAVLAHRAELHLSEDQVQWLQSRDDRLEKDNAAIREAMAQRKKQLGHGETDPFGAGMGAGSRGGRGGHSMGGARGKPANDPLHAAQDQLDDNDTKAYLDAENLLTEEQRRRAREIAERFREELWDRRQAMQKQARASGE